MGKNLLPGRLGARCGGYVNFLPPYSVSVGECCRKPNTLGAFSLSSHRSCDDLKASPKLRLAKATEQPQALISSSPII